jgi:hypothetical protein
MSDRRYAEDFLLLPENHCPSCHKTLDAVGEVGTGSKSTQQPQPGDLTVCTGCLRVLCFTEHLGLRLATQAEEGEFAEVIAQFRADMRQLWPATGGRWLPKGRRTP